jgi:hypothetical protein
MAEMLVMSDTPSTPALRARAVVPTDTELFGACGLSALWVHGLISEPHRHSVTMLTPKRPNHAVLESRIVRELDLSRTPLVDFGGRKCLGPLDALEEVARNPQVSDVVATQAIAFAVTREKGLRTGLVQRIEQLPALPYTELARARLAVADSIHVVDGINAANRVEHAFEVHNVAHLKDETTERQALLSGVHRSRQDVDVVL